MRQMTPFADNFLTLVLRRKLQVFLVQRCNLLSGVVQVAIVLYHIISDCKALFTRRLRGNDASGLGLVLVIAGQQAGQLNFFGAVDDKDSVNGMLQR